MLSVNAAVLVTGVAAQKLHLTAVHLTQIKLINLNLKPEPTSRMLLTLKPPPNTMLKPCHVWFLLPWAEMHINTFYDLAVCQDMVFWKCSPNGLDSCLNWWSSWRKASKTFGPVARTVSRLARPPRLLLLSPASLPLSLTHAQTHSLSTEIPFTRICGHSLCALMGKRRQRILPLAGPRGLWTVEKLLSKAIRVLLGSGPVTASPWPSEGLWSVGKQREDGLHPGTLSYSLTAFSGVAQTLKQSS